MSPEYLLVTIVTPIVGQLLRRVDASAFYALFLVLEGILCLLSLHSLNAIKTPAVKRHGITILMPL